ncbi:MAG: hypothetical protein IPM57_11395 [Oligoflexia bacterium]|nr:hypothetical protein [Oligoflexia bacterium]
MVALLIVLLFSQNSEAITYSAYRTIAQGSARNIGMGGAFVGLENDSSSVWLAPSTLPFSSLRIDLNLTQSQTFSTEPTPTNTSGEIVRSDYNMFSVTFLTAKDNAFVIGFGQPYIEGHGNPIYNNSGLWLDEYRASHAKKLSKHISAAPVLIYRRLNAKYAGYRDVSNNYITSEQLGESIDIGLSVTFKLDDWLSTISWENERTYNLGNPQGYTVLTNGIQPVKIPATTRLGISKTFPEVSIIVSAQLDWFIDTKGLSSYLDSQATTNTLTSTKNNLFIPRLGFEHQFVDKFWVKSWVRLGYYVEQPKIDLQVPRGHWTIGGEAKIWVMFLNFAYDYASGYANAATSMGITISDYW